MKYQFEESKFDNLLEQFINPEELTNFLKQLQKRGIEKMLEGGYFGVTMPRISVKQCHS